MPWDLPHRHSLHLGAHGHPRRYPPIGKWRRRESNPRDVPAALPAAEFESRMGLCGFRGSAETAWLCGSGGPRRPPERTGTLPRRNVSQTEAAEHWRCEAAVGEASGEVLSQYHSRFTQGATIVPRVLIIVEDAPQGPLGIAAGQRSVRSNRSALEKAPWRELDSLENVVEESFVRPLLLGSTLLPFRMLEPALAVVPWQGERLLHGDDDELDDYPGLASWWRRAEELWEATAGATTSASSSGRRLPPRAFRPVPGPADPSGLQPSRCAPCSCSS